jgi:hypothetical protein
MPPFRPTGILPSAPYSLPPQAPFRPSLPPPHAPFRVRPSLPSASGRPWMLIGRSRVRRRGASERVRYQCVNALPEYVTVAARRLIRCRRSCPPVVARLAVHARSHSMAPNEWPRARTRLWYGVCATNPARPALPPHGHQLCVRTPNVARTAISLPCSRLGRRASRNEALPVHDLHRMGREACCRHDIGYLVSWRRVTPRPV